MNSKAITAIFMVYLGCGLNNIFLEYLIKQDPGCGNLITFLQFTFIAAHGVIFTAKFGTVKPKIGLRDYFNLVIMFFITNAVNNWAFNFNIPVPLHMIFRAGSLIANMIMGIIILKKKYPFSKYLSVALITLGIIICTLMSSGKTAKACTDCDLDVKEQNQQDQDHFFWWIIGITLLTGALLLSARMGIYQEYLTAKYGKHPEEALFYTHLLALPGFLVYFASIRDHYEIAIESEPYHIPFLEITIPLLIIYLIGNVFTQYLCISSVYVLTSECSSLTLTLVITLRKFLSLLFSIIYFQNPFTWVHWFGTALVFGGTLIFTEVPQKIKDSRAKAKTE